MASQSVASEQPDDHVRGPANAAITIIEYGDYDCPHTRSCQAELDRLLTDNPDVKLIFRHFPLRHLHSDAEGLSRIAEAAARLSGAFWPLHERFMAHAASIDEDSVREATRALNLDLKQILAAVDDPEIAARVERDVGSGKASGVHSTPSFFFDGVLHDGHYDYETLLEQLNRARSARASRPQSSAE